MFRFPVPLLHHRFASNWSSSAHTGYAIQTKRFLCFVCWRHIWSLLYNWAMMKGIFVQLELVLDVGNPKEVCISMNIPKFNLKVFIHFDAIRMPKLKLYVFLINLFATTKFRVNYFANTAKGWLVWRPNVSIVTGCRKWVCIREFRRCSSYPISDRVTSYVW